MENQCLKIAMSAGFLSLGLIGSADAALSERLGGLAYYDDVADLTWLADANNAQTTGYDNDGLMNWVDAGAWAAQLTVNGVGGWRLPNTLQPDPTCFGQLSVGTTFQSDNFYCTGSELGNLFYNTLGGSVLNSITTTNNSNYDLFNNVQSGVYWSATEQEFGAVNLNGELRNAWLFHMENGFQSTGDKLTSFYGWAVQSGDVSAVPIPASAWLFGSGLLSLIGVARRKKCNA